MRAVFIQQFPQNLDEEITLIVLQYCKDFRCRDGKSVYLCTIYVLVLSIITWEFTKYIFYLRRSHRSKSIDEREVFQQSQVTIGGNRILIYYRIMGHFFSFLGNWFLGNSQSFGELRTERGFSSLSFTDIGKFTQGWVLRMWFWGPRGFPPFCASPGVFSGVHFILRRLCPGKGVPGDFGGS